MVTLLGSELEIQYITLHTVYSNLSVYKCELQRNLEVIHRQNFGKLISLNYS